MLILEIKRVIKSRNNLVIIGLVLVLSILLGIAVPSMEVIWNPDMTKAYTGFTALDKERELESVYNGEVTEQMFYDITEKYQSLLEQYGGEIPNEVYVEEYYGAKAISDHFPSIFYDKDTGMDLTVADLTPAEAAEFYEVRRACIDQMLDFNLAGSASAREQAASISAQVAEPFYFSSFTGWDTAGEYTHLLALLIVLLCTMVAAPIFSSDYQTQADAVMRTTKHGRMKLAAVKTGSSLLIVLILFGICVGLFLIILCITLGTEGLKSSLQMIYAITIVPLSIGQSEAGIVLSSFLTLLAVVCFTLWISARVENPMITLVSGLIVVLLPTILRMGPDIKLLNWLTYILPSSGVGVGGGIYYEFVFRNTFLTLGNAAFWAPVVMCAAPVIWIAVCIPLTMRAYCRHKRK